MQNTVKTLMCRDLVTVRPEATLQEAARLMREVECGVLPVGSRDAVEGIITDRDIVIRAVAEGKDPANEKVHDCMTNEVYYCNADDTLDKAADQMREHQVNRLLVRDSGGKICGILTFGRIIRDHDSARTITSVINHATGQKKAA